MNKKNKALGRDTRRGLKIAAEVCQDAAARTLLHTPGGESAVKALFGP